MVSYDSTQGAGLYQACYIYQLKGSTGGIEEELQVTIDYTVRAENDFDVSFGECDALVTTCPTIGGLAAVWSSEKALDDFAFLFMDNDSAINLPSISSPSDVFDDSGYDHDLHVLTDTEWQACPSPPDATCLTDANLLAAGDDGHPLYRLNTDLDSLAIGS